MNPSTETLIKIINNPISVMKDYHKGRLQGRLDSAEEWLSFEQDEVNKTFIQNEINKIKDALSELSEVNKE